MDVRTCLEVQITSKRAANASLSQDPKLLSLLYSSYSLRACLTRQNFTRLLNKILPPTLAVRCVDSYIIHRPPNTLPASISLDVCGTDICAVSEFHGPGNFLVSWTARRRTTRMHIGRDVVLNRTTVLLQFLLFFAPVVALITLRPISFQ